MKYILLLSLFLPGITFAQIIETVCDAVHPIVITNWNGPVNDVTNRPLNNPARYMNGLDWNSLTGIPLTNMEFAGVTLNQMSSICSNQLLGGYYRYLYDGASVNSRAHLPVEGWELLLVNVGRYPDNITALESVKYKSLPYIVLYNRYRGLIRVFVGMGPDKNIHENADALAVTLSFISNSGNNNMTGLLRLYEGHDKSLDQTTDVIHAQSVSKAVSTQVDWASCDFQIAYDPCTCSIPSMLSLTFTHIKQQELSLYGRSLTYNDNDILTSELTVNENEYLTGYDFTIVDQDESKAKQGLIINRALENTINDYIARYEEYQRMLKLANEHNEKVANNLALLRMAKFVIGFVASSGANIGALATINGAQTAGALFALEYLANGQATTLDDGNWFNRAVKAFGGIVKNTSSSAKKIDEKILFKALKTVLGEDGDIFVQENFETMSIPNAPAKPTSTLSFSEMSFKGKITTKMEKPGPVFYTPGTYGEAHPQGNLTGDEVFSYPVYNEVLGVFALLETPKIIISKTVEHDSIFRDYIPADPYNNSDLFRQYQSWTKHYQFKLDKDLKYTFNPALDIRSYKISPSFKVYLKKKRLIYSRDGSFRRNCFIDPFFTTNVESKNFNLDKYDPVQTAGTNYYNGANFYTTAYPTIPAVNKDAILIQTPFIDVNAFYSSVYAIGLKNEFNLVSNSLFHSTVPSATSGYELEIDSIELKLLVEVEFNSLNEAGMNNTLTEIMTYKLNPSDVNQVQWTNSALFTGLEQSSSNFTQFPENLNLGNIVFSGQAVEGCKLVGNIYTCRAYNDIGINGDLSVSGAYSVNIIAGNEIVQSEESNVAHEIELSIQSVMNYSHTMPEATPAYVKGFCQNTNPNAPSYQANRISAKGMMTMGETDESSDIYEADFDYTIYPNPASDHAFISLTDHSEKQAISIQVFDISGRKQNIAFSYEAENGYEIDLAGFSKGIYLVRVDSKGRSGTKQLIIK